MAGDLTLHWLHSWWNIWVDLNGTNWEGHGPQGRAGKGRAGEGGRSRSRSRSGQARPGQARPGQVRSGQPQSRAEQAWSRAGQHGSLQEVTVGANRKHGVASTHLDDGTSVLSDCWRSRAATPSPPTKSSGFRGFDSSRLLILKGGNSHVREIV